MRGIRPPALFELRAQESNCKGWRNAVDSHHTSFSGSPLFSKQVRLARPVDIPNWSAWGDLHSQGCSILSRTGLLFPINHTPVGDPGLAPGRLGDFKSPGSAVPAEASRREMVGMKRLAPPRLPDSESGPSAIRVKPHARKLVHPAGLPPANSPFEAEDDHNFTTDAEMACRAEARTREFEDSRSKPTLGPRSAVLRRHDRSRFSNTAQNVEPVQSCRMRRKL